MFLNKFVKKVTPYKVCTHKAWAKAKNHDVLKLDWNESTIPPSPKVKVAIQDFLENSFMNWYPDVDNIELRSALSKYSNVDVDNLEYFGSSDSLHEYIIRAFINEGDVITMISPTYDNFRAAAESVGAEIDYFYLSVENKFNFSFDLFEQHIDNMAPKIVYLCNPNNPTGTLYDVELIKKIVTRFNDVLFIIDEAYYEFVGTSASCLTSSFENIVVCRTFSKAFGLASFRIGYAISSVHNINGLKKIRNPKNISSCAQFAALGALSDIPYMQKYVDEVLAAKKWFIKGLSALGYDVLGQDGGNFILVKFGVNQTQIVNMLEKNDIFLRNYGHVFGMADYTRITIGTHEQMQRVLIILEAIHSNQPTS